MWEDDQVEESELVYHYTNTHGLQGIIANKAIWATDVWYMNDTREATFGLDVIEAFLTSKRSDKDDRTDEFAVFCIGLIQSLRGQHSKIPGSLISCFSKNADQLSQWRAYGADSGFSIGFDRHKLEQLSSEVTGVSQHTMREVIYNRDHQFLALDSYYPRTINDIGMDSMKFINSVLVLAPALKNDAFREEAEVRLHLFQGVDDAARRALKFRASMMGLTPYMETKLWTDDTATASPIREIVIGPTAYPVQAERAISQLLACHGLEHVRLRRSEVPLRP